MNAEVEKMRRLTMVLLVAGLVVAGCGDAKRFGIEIAFPDDAAREQTARVRVNLIVPGPDAGCAALLNGTAAPGDAGYETEDQLVIDLPATSGAEPLKAGEPGPRLFFAEGEDSDGQAILRGCAAVDARRSGPDVIIQLEWIGPPCEVDADCDDGNDCTTDTCQAGACDNAPVGDGAPCDDGDYCTDPDSCTSGVCGGAARDCSGAADDCNTGVCDELADACVPVPVGQGAPCEDGLFCSDGDACDAAGVCQAGAGTPCSGECVSGCDEGADACTYEPGGTPCTSDGTFCNGVEACDGNGTCASPGDPCPADECAACQEASDTCATPSGAPCTDDGLDCTSNEACDGNGACVGTADDAYCDAITAGNLCIPACSGDASGCVAPPATAALVCDDPVDLGTTDTAACTFSLTGPDAAGQGSCLSCRGLVGAGLVEDADFDDVAGACSLDGWALTTSSGNNCRAKIDGCAPGGQPRSCCDDFASICDDVSFADPVLVADHAVQCAGAEPQWRLSKTFDFSGLTDLRLCFDVAEEAAGASTGLLVWAEDGSNGQQTLFCQLGEPIAGTDGLWRTECVDLPAWAVGSPDTLLTFVVHSDADGERIWLDNIRISGWSGGCAPTSGVALTDDFAGCDTSAWTFPAGSFTCAASGCANQNGWAPGIFGDGPNLAMETSVDTTGLHGRVVACLRAGTLTPAPGDGLRLLLDAGAGWQSAWAHAGSLGPDGDCLEICVDLSALDPAVAGNPALGLRLETDGSGTVGIFGLRVSGAQFCAADPATLSLSSPGDVGGGDYDFTATDAAGGQLFGRIDCQWDPDPAFSAQQSIWYHP